MRIEKNVQPITIGGRSVAFRDWVFSVGDGSEQSFLLGDDPDPSWIKIPDEVRTSKLSAILNLYNGHYQ